MDHLLARQRMLLLVAAFAVPLAAAQEAPPPAQPAEQPAAEEVVEEVVDIDIAGEIVIVGRRGDRNITTPEFSQFLDDLLATQRLFLKYSDELDEFSFYKDAALTAKKMRDDFFTKRAAEKQTTRDTVRSPNPRRAQNTMKHVKMEKQVSTKPSASVQTTTRVFTSAPPPSKNVWAERKKVAKETAATTTAIPSVPEAVVEAEQDPISEEDKEFVTVMVRNASRGNTRRFESQNERT